MVCLSFDHSLRRGARPYCLGPRWGLLVPSSDKPMFPGGLLPRCRSRLSVACAKCTRHRDPRQQDDTTLFCGQDQMLHRGLPMRLPCLSWRQRDDVDAGVAQRGELATIGQFDRIIEAARRAWLCVQWCASGLKRPPARSCTRSDRHSQRSSVLRSTLASARACERPPVSVVSIARLRKARAQPPVPLSSFSQPHNREKLRLRRRPVAVNQPMFGQSISGNLVLRVCADAVTVDAQAVACGNRTQKDKALRLAAAGCIDFSRLERSHDLVGIYRRLGRSSFQLKRARRSTALLLAKAFEEIHNDHP